MIRKKLPIKQELDDILSGEIQLENQHIEIKETFRLSDHEIESYKYNNIYKVRNETINGRTELLNKFKYLCAREIAGFLNTKDGRLYIGIGDKANPSRDVKGFVMLETLDKTNQDLNNFLENTFTKIITQECIKTNFIKYNSKYICVIEIKEVSQKYWPVLIGSYNKQKMKNLFYIRRDDETETITDTQEIIDLVKNYESSNQIKKPKNFDWTDEEFLLLAYVEKDDFYNNDPKKLIILHDKGWKKAADITEIVDEEWTDKAIKVANDDIYIDDLADNALRYLGNKVRLNFNYGGLVEISIGNSKQIKSEYFSDTINKLEIINGKNLREFWNLEILKITTNKKTLYTLPNIFGYFLVDPSYQISIYFENPFDFKKRIQKEIKEGKIEPPPNYHLTYDLPEPVWFGDNNYKDALGHKISGQIVEFENLTFISDIHINNDIDFDMVEGINSDKTKTKYH